MRDTAGETAHRLRFNGIFGLVLLVGLLAILFALPVGQDRMFMPLWPLSLLVLLLILAVSLHLLLDAWLFQLVARSPDEASGLVRIDAILTRIEFWRARRTRPARPLADRIAGANRLIRRQRLLIGLGLVLCLALKLLPLTGRS